MTGRGAARPATTPQSGEFRALLPSHAANQATRGPRFEGMERMFGKAEEPHVTCRGNSRQLRQVSPSGAQNCAPGHAMVSG